MKERLQKDPSSRDVVGSGPKYAEITYFFQKLGSGRPWIFKTQKFLTTILF